MNEVSSMDLNKERKIVMHNDLIKSKSELSLNEIKLLRLAIMQIVKTDKDLRTYQVKIADLAKLLEVPTSNMYRDIQNICIHLRKEVLLIGDGNPRHKWKVSGWVDTATYEEGIITIKLSEDLKPYLIELSGLYTQYLLEDILYLKSVYSIRLYELIRQEMKYKPVYADKTADVYISEETIRKATNTEKKYEKHGMFRTRVIDLAVSEITEKTCYRVTFTCYREHRKVVGYNFHIESKNNISG